MAILKIHPPQIEKSIPTLACPTCHCPLQLTAEYLLCTTCSLLYPIIDTIPVLIPDRAIPAK